MNIYICIDGDDIGAIVGQNRQADDVPALKRISQAIQAGNDLFANWCDRYHGNVIENGGDEVALEVPADALIELPKIREQYKDITGHTVSVGIGHRISEANKALISAKLNGKDRITLYSAAVEKQNQDISSQPEQTEEQKIKDEYFKSEEPFSVEQLQKEEDFLTKLLELAQDEISQEDQEKQDEFKRELLQTLDEIKEFAPSVEQLKGQAPELYQSFVKLVQGTLAIAQNVGGKEVEKSDELEKGIPLPVGATMDTGATSDRQHAGKIKVRHSDGNVGVISARSGLVMSPDGHAASAKNPNAK